jgi:hypothetical protein
MVTMISSDGRNFVRGFMYASNLLWTWNSLFWWMICSIPRTVHQWSNHDPRDKISNPPSNRKIRESFEPHSSYIPRQKSLGHRRTGSKRSAFRGASYAFANAIGRSFRPLYWWCTERPFSTGWRGYVRARENGVGAFRTCQVSEDSLYPALLTYSI